MWIVDGATMLADAPVDKDAKEAAAEVRMGLTIRYCTSLASSLRKEDAVLG
jgi:hypothetical protein